MQKDFVSGIEAVNKTAVEAVKRFSEIQLKAMERLTEQQIAATSDYMNKGVAQMQALAGSKDLQSAFASQSKFMNELNETMVDNAKTVAGILTETRDEMSAWFEEGMKAAADNPVAKAVSKKAA